jgi:hypothetical protein
MIGKLAGNAGHSSPAALIFPLVLGFAVLGTVPRLVAQDPPQPPAQDSSQPQQQPPQQAQPAQQPADNGQSSSTEATPEETQRRVKAPTFLKWQFNVGGGAGLTTGTTKTYVRSGGGIAAAGAARNFSQFFGFRLDFQWDNLPLRDSALSLAQAPGASSHVYSLMLDPIFYLPFNKEWSAYIVGGPSYYHRSGKLDSSSAIIGSPCNGFWDWWGACYADSIPLTGQFLHASQNEIGENFGGGIAHRVRSNIEVYAEFRIMHGSHDNITTDLRPITIGVRW